jgi:hypothetical protein
MRSPRCSICHEVVWRSPTPSGKLRHYYEQTIGATYDHEPVVTNWPKERTPSEDEQRRIDEALYGHLVHRGQDPNCPTCEDITLHAIGVRTRAKSPFEDVG